MNRQKGFVEWVLLLKIVLVVVAAVGSTLLGVDTYTESILPPASSSILHEGVVQSVEYGSWYQFNQIVTFQDGAKYAMPSSCRAVQGAYLRILTNDKAQTVICE